MVRNPLPRRLRRDHPDAAFIALTGYGQARDRDLSRQAGFDHHLVKPVEIRALSDILAQLPPRPPKQRRIRLEAEGGVASEQGRTPAVMTMPVDNIAVP